MIRAISIFLLVITGITCAWYFGTETRTDIDTKSGKTRTVNQWLILKVGHPPGTSVLSHWLPHATSGSPNWVQVSSKSPRGDQSSCYLRLSARLATLAINRQAKHAPLPPEVKSAIATRILHELDTGTNICRISKAMEPIIDRFTADSANGTPTSSEEIIKAMQQPFP